MAILPPTPGNFSINGNGANRIDIAWTFSEPLGLIGGFTLERAEGGAFSTRVDLIPSNQTLYQDTVTPGILYTYRLRSVSGAYRSIATPELSATSN